MNNINKIKLVIAVALLLIVGASCEDALDQIPSDKVPVERLLNKGSIVDFRENAYKQLPLSFTDFNSGTLLEAYTDDAFRAGDGTSYEWHNGLLSLSSTFFSGSVWNDCWQGIRRCNLAMEYLPQSEVDTSYLTKEQINLYIDEVKILRSWYHFMLVKNFGPVPFLDKAYGPSFDGWKDLVRPSYQAISDQLVQELDGVINSSALGLRRRSESEYVYMNKAVAYALKSRILLYNASSLNNPTGDAKKWQAAADAAQQCIDAITPEYGLVPMADYSTLFIETFDKYNKEVIYKSPVNGAGITNGSNGIDLLEYGSKDQNSNCGAVPTQELVDCFELKNGNLPVTYTNTDHTGVTPSAGYNDATAYENRDARFYETILFNGAYYGKMQDIDDSVVVYTYEGRLGSGFNDQVLNQDDAFKRLSCTGYYTRKFRAANYWGAKTGTAVAHKVFFRLAEVYLNLAEARCELGELDKALAALNMVRERAGQPKLQDVPGYIASQDFIMSRIRNERRVELCFEGHRYYDQRRWKILDSTNGAITGMKITSTGGDLGPFTYERVKIDVDRKATTDKYLELPIISSEIRRLPSLGQPAAWQ